MEFGADWALKPEAAKWPIGLDGWESRAAGPSETEHEVEGALGFAREGLVGEVGVDYHVLFGGDFVVGGELGRRRTDGVHEAGVKEDFGLNARGEKLDVDVAEFFKNGGFALVAGIEGAEVEAEFFVGGFSLVHFPDALVVAEKRVDGSDAFEARLKRGAGEGEGTALGGTHRTDAGGVHFGERHDDAGELGGIEEDLAEEQFLGVGIVEAADDVTAEGVALHAAPILGAPTLAAAVHGGDAKAGAGVGELGDPVAGLTGVAVELKDGGVFCRRPGAVFGPEVFGVDPGAADAGEPEVETFDVRRSDYGGGAEFGARVGGIEFAKGFSPVGVVVGGSGIPTGVVMEFGERQVDEGHF